jgi:hypothetical protein
MIVQTINRMARGMDYPSMVGSGSAESLVGELEAPGTSFQAKSYGMASLGCASCQEGDNQSGYWSNRGLGTVFEDLTTGNWSALPTDLINGLNPATFDIGSYLIVGGLAWLLLMKGRGLGGGSRSASRQLSRKAKLTGAIAQDRTLLGA